MLPTERVETEKEQPARQAKNTADTEENTAAKAVADVAKNDAAKSKNTQEKKTSTEETDKKDKVETVYVKADADGTPNKITVETVLRAPENGEKIADVSTLSISAIRKATRNLRRMRTAFSGGRTRARTSNIRAQPGGTAGAGAYPVFSR